ncbi:MAG: NusG domain II-containing protein [Clostridia bacterium]|nr:NusG domain II-containing protein [Clostridia bacterium]
MRKADIVLIAAFIIIAAISGILLMLFRSDGAYAVVTIDGEKVMSLPLDEDTKVLIGEGEKTNLLVIKDGKASIKEASCPDHICVRTGEICHEGETIVCLPHRLVVSISGGDEGADTVSR